MIDMMLAVVLVLMIVLAIVTVLSHDLFAAVITLAALSFLSAFLYVLLGAPDVALAEAVIGATIATVIFLITLKKYRIFYIYLMGTDKEIYSMDILQKITQTLRRDAIEVHLLQVDKTPQALLQEHHCDLVVEKRGDALVLHGEHGNVHLAHIEASLQDEIEAQRVFIETDI